MDTPSANPIIPLPLSGQSILNQARQAAAAPSAAPAAAATTGQRPVPASIKRVGDEFESMFLSEMLKPMFEGLSTDELGGGGEGEEMFRPMLIDQYAKSISKSGGVGVADAVVRELMRMQEASAPPPAAPAAGTTNSETTKQGADHGPHG